MGKFLEGKIGLILGKSMPELINYSMFMFFLIGGMAPAKKGKPIKSSSGGSLVATTEKLGKINKLMN